MFISTVKKAVANAVSNTCKSDVIRKEELETVLTNALVKIFTDRDFARFIDEKISERRK